jgi:tetrahydromethanopterin S-methyltransferase subunit A
MRGEEKELSWNIPNGALSYLREAVEAKKCHHCGCFHSFLRGIDKNFPEAQRPAEFNDLIKQGRERLNDIRYDCFGCEVCYPPTVLNTLEKEGVIRVVEADSCFTEIVEERGGWPPLAGSYKVLRYHAPVAVCTLTTEELIPAVAQIAATDIAIAGSLQTENIGIERLIQNILANPNIRFLIVCGEDSRRAVGHLPGESLLALSQNGLDGDGRIVGARGKRPFLHNISYEAVEHFRGNIEIIDLIGNCQVPVVLEKARACAERNPGPSEPFTTERAIKTVQGYIPQKMAPDSAGYFIIYVDRARQILSLEHYRNDGVLDNVIEGKKAAELYFPAIDQGLISRLDHACYLGKELARAEQALLTGEPYIQDGVPEQEPSSLMTVSECSATCNCKRSIS